MLKNAEEFLKAQWENATVQEAVKLIKDEQLELTSALEAIKEGTDKRSNNQGIKTLQKLIYEKGYADGHITTQ